MICTYDADDLRKSGLPTKRYVNLYEKFGNGGFGVLLTGNVQVDPVSAADANHPLQTSARYAVF